MNGMILDLEHFAVHDGPGIRLVVFLKGCPLRCMWCHTPESQPRAVELLYQQEHCLQCGSCGKLYEKLPCADLNSSQLAVIGNCPTGAIKSAGKVVSADWVIAEAVKEKMFFDESNGGLTISGGEPLFQGDFTTELLQLAKKENISSCVETCGFGDYKYLQKWIDLTQIFLFDYKVSDPSEHQRLTGADNLLIKENLEKLSYDGAEIHLRCPLIPDVNDSLEHLLEIAATAERLAGIKEVHIEPYHPMARGKYQSLGRSYEHLPEDFPPEEKIAYYIKTISSNTAKKVLLP